MRDIAEILEHWQAGRSICAISRSLGVCRVTIRKYVYMVEARGYHQGDPTPPQGWKAFIAEVIPRPPDPSTRSETFARLLPYQEEIRAALSTTKAATVWQRLRDDKKVKVSKPSFYRYLSCFLSDVWKNQPIITVRRDDPPPGDEVQIDFGYLGIWQDPKTGKKTRLWAFAMILSFSRHMFVRVVTKMDQREWLECHILAFEFNLVERWFREITEKRIRRDSFESVPQLITAIEEYLTVTNENPKPFVWHKSAQTILDKISGCKAVYETLH